MHEISLLFCEGYTPIKPEETDGECFFMIETVKAVVSPHYNAKNMSANGFFTFLLISQAP
jgi:hypothetical protein